MVIERIHQFINSLSLSEGQLSKTDLDLLADFKTRFLQLDSMSPLSEDDQIWIVANYELRWKNITRDRDRTDAIVKSTLIHQLWIDFAYDLDRDLLNYYLGNDDKAFYAIDESIRIDTQRAAPQSTELADNECKETHTVALSIKELFRIRNKTSTITLIAPPQTRSPNTPIIYSLTSESPVSVKSFNSSDTLMIGSETDVVEEIVTERQSDSDLLQIEDTHSLNCWNFLRRTLAPTWHKVKHTNYSLFFELLDLINQYQPPPSDNTLFKNKLVAFNSTLLEVSCEEANYFYSFIFDCQGRKTYLFEILVDFWANDGDLSLKLIDLARGIIDINPTLISVNPIVQPLYQSMAVGPYFNLLKLRQLLAELKVNDLLVVQALFKLNQMLVGMKQISSEVIAQLHLIYQLRATSVIDKKYDYFDLQDCANQPWIKLAQFLAGAHLIADNYYRFLIPTLQQDTVWSLVEMVPVPVVMAPLSDYILAEGNQRLIYLPDSVRQHQKSNLFRDWSDPENPRLLTAIEEKRVIRVAPEYEKYFKSSDLAITKKTVEAIKALVVGSVFRSGMVFDSEYSTEEYQKMFQAYDVFVQYVTYLENEDPVELENLYAQPIQYHQSCMTFAEVMSLIQSTNLPEGRLAENDRCTAINGNYFIKLVLDYDQDASFSVELDQYIELHGLRLESTEKKYRDPVDQEEAVRRLMVMLLSLMTHKFNFLPYTWRELKVLGEINWVTETGMKIFNQIKPLIESGDLSRAKLIYNTILRDIIDPAIYGTYWTPLTRYPDTTAWLNNIKTEELFKRDNSIYFSVEGIFQVLMTRRAREGDGLKKNLLGDLLDELLKTERMRTEFLNASKSVDFCLAVNIRFNKLLNEVKYQVIKDAVLVDLRSKDQLTTADGMTLISNYLVTRLTEPTRIGQMASFFSEGSLQSSTYTEVKEIIRTAIQHLNPAEGLYNFIKLIDQLISRSNELVPAQREKMHRYLLTLGPQLNTQTLLEPLARTTVSSALYM